MRSSLRIITLISFLVAAVIGCGGGDGGSSDPFIPGGDFDWVIMYYVDADCNLEEYLLNDFNEIEGIDVSGKSVKVVALVDRINGYYSGDGNWIDTRAFDIGYDSAGYNSAFSSGSRRFAIPELGVTSSGDSGEVNMGDGATLKSFVSFVKSHYTANNYMVLFTNHGGGWRGDPDAMEKRIRRIVKDRAVCWDDTSGGDSLNVSEIRTALEGAGFTGSSKLKIVAMDACLMGMVEVAAELKGVAEIMVASEEIIPGYGYPYTQIMRTLRDNSAAITPQFFATTIVHEYYQSYTGGTNVEEPGKTVADITLSAVDLTKIDAVVTAVNGLGQEMTISNADSRLKSDSYASPEFVDIYDFCVKETGFTTQRTALKNAIDSAVIAHKAGTVHAGSRGLSVYFPVSKHLVDSDYSPANIQFAGSASSWVAFIGNFDPTSAFDGREICSVESGGLWYVGNNDPDSALALENAANGTRLNVGSLPSFIYSPSDIDCWYIPENSNISISMTVPSGCDYDLTLIDAASWEGLDSSINGISESESVWHTGNSPSGFGYILVVTGYGGTYNTEDPYLLNRTD